MKNKAEEYINKLTEDFEADFEPPIFGQDRKFISRDEWNKKYRTNHIRKQIEKIIKELTELNGSVPSFSEVYSDWSGVGQGRLLTPKTNEERKIAEKIYTELTGFEVDSDIANVTSLESKLETAERFLSEEIPVGKRVPLNIEIRWDDLTPAKQDAIAQEFVNHQMGAMDEIDYDGELEDGVLGNIQIYSI